jgi:peptide/nickel transport system permease protein
LVTIPYSEAVRLWRGGEEVWYKLPKNAAPAWTNFFRANKLPETVILDSKTGEAEKTFTDSTSGKKIELLYTYDYEASQFPQDLILYFTSVYKEKPPFVSAYWETPDGREIRIADIGMSGSKHTYRFSQDSKLQRRLGGVLPQQGLFADPASETPKPLKGIYRLRLSVITFEENTDLDAELVQHGLVYGVAGTDHLRRDLTIALLWGIPIAMSFGLLAAVGTTLTAMVIAAFGTWYGGWVDDLIQRITEVNLVLPFLPILIMIGTFYTRSIFAILGATILLSIFGGAIKGYRAIFMQLREAPFIEAARAYGASNARIIFNYLVPRIIPMLIPALVSGIPGYVFLEASLAVLGLGDPVLPTWGKIIQDAQGNGALYQGLYYWILEPAVLLMITGLGFAMLGFSLDRIFNPRLRGV